MYRQLFAVVLLVLTSSLSQAQPEPEPKDDKVTIPLMLSPSPLPKPLSRYYLYPEYGDQQPGEPRTARARQQQHRYRQSRRGQSGERAPAHQLEAGAKFP